MASVSYEEKRLKQLKQQLFGNEQTVSLDKAKLNTIPTQKPAAARTTLLDPISLKSDLIKIVIFSAIALAIQFSLFFASRQGLINLFK